MAIANRVPKGQRFGRLTFIEIMPHRSADHHLIGLWSCDCGKQREIMITRVVNGTTRSCGCLMEEVCRVIGIKHGMRGSRTYKSWLSMRRRCLCADDKDYPRWGAKGIGIDPRWMNFQNFFADMGERPNGTTLDRIDGTKGYGPSNCRWATAQEQNRNKENFVVVGTPLGEMPLIDYAAMIGLTRGAAWQRLKRGKLEGCARI